MSLEPHFENETLVVSKASVGKMDNTVYVVACKNTARSVIVDAAAEPETIVALVKGTDPIAIVTTHGHADHVGATREVARRLGIPFRLHPADRNICPIIADEDLETGRLVIGAAHVQIVHTPGHTPGSISIAMSGAVLTGDTLFPGGPGATRFSYSDFDQIMNSIERELMTMPDESIVMPGHGLDTTIGRERPSLPEWRERRW